MTTAVHSTMPNVAAARQRCMRFRRRILDISQTVSALHIAPAFSCLETVDLIYHELMRRKNGQSPDTFIMSKGHGCMSQYVVLEELGILTTEDLAKYCKSSGQLGAHPDYGVPGIEASTGSLGHGLSMAVGMAYAEKIKDSGGRVYAVLSDGEVQEGSTWEAFMMGATLGVNNLIAFIDNNDFQSLGRTSETHPSFYPLTDKFRAFGWEAVELNGHDVAGLYQAVMTREGKKPFVIVCKTVKGRGVKYMENVPIWHYRAPNKDEYQQAIRDLVEVTS
ncbi:MAG: transketolase [Nitrospiraceae bacterium]